MPWAWWYAACTLELAGSGTLLRCLVDDDRGLLAGLVGKFRLRQRIELRLLALPAGFEKLSDADAAAMPGLVLGDRSLQRLCNFLIPGQLVIARLARTGQLQPEIHAVVLLQIG